MNDWKQGGGRRDGFKSRGGGFDRGEGNGRRDMGRRERFGGNDASSGGEGSGDYAPRQSYGERKPYGERKSFGDRKPYGDRGGFGGGDRKPYGDRGGFGGGERKPYGERSSFGGGDRKPYGERSEGFSGERRPYGERKSFGDRKPYGDRGGFGGGERRPYGDRKPYGDRGDRGGFGGDRGGFGGERKPYGDRAERRPQEDGWIAGTNAVCAVLRAKRRDVREMWLSHEPSGELAELLAARPDITPVTKAKEEFDNKFGTLIHQGVALLGGNLPQPDLGEFLATNPKMVVAIDQVTDPHNLGAIIRSCAAFGVAAVLVPSDRTATLTPVVARTSAGAIETVPVIDVGNLAQTLNMLKERGFMIVGLAGEGETNLTGVRNEGPLCVVVGSEGEGLRRLTREMCDRLVRIPIADSIESLNVSVATGVALYALTR